MPKSSCVFSPSLDSSRSGLTRTETLVFAAITLILVVALSSPIREHFAQAGGERPHDQYASRPIRHGQ